MYDHTFAKFANHQIRTDIKWAVSLVIAYGHFNLPQRFVWVCIFQIRPHTKWAVSLVIAYGHFNLPQGFVWVCVFYCMMNGVPSTHVQNGHSSLNTHPYCPVTSLWCNNGTNAANNSLVSITFISLNQSALRTD